MTSSEPPVGPQPARTADTPRADAAAIVPDFRARCTEPLPIPVRPIAHTNGSAIRSKVYTTQVD
ncbi:hypothetical protein GCM10010269_53240 [Streptomyces humidus]|uniref:Uncharacterized protein n=1 Tax=Streptomyces humidus TaxID=52259 RepID=A0A918L5F5_9ACTN|nr:hypothetical protein GCM10010269_53240 [Streptomyces humidus]